jgi:hypothetical protein
MSRCLSDEALMRVVAELGTAAEQAHLAACAACAARRRKVSDEVDRIREVLLTMPEPVRRTAPRPRWSMIGVAGLAAVAVAALVWIEVTAWKTIQTAEDLASVEQTEAALADVTAAIFSVDGEPARVFAESAAATGLDPDDDASTGCDEPRWLDEAECAGSLPSFEDPEDSIEMDTTERTVFDTDRSDQGGG